MSANLDLLYPYVKKKAEAFILECKKQGIIIQITCTYRSVQEQNELYAQGRTIKGVIVTNARGGDSIHQYKCAFDIAVVNPDGKTLNWSTICDTNHDNKKDYYQVGEIGKALGLTWGGDFTSIIDVPHFQYTGGLTLSDFKNGKVPNFPSEESESTMTLLKIGSKGQDVVKLQTLLISKGYKLNADGDFGNGTLAAVKDFQAKNGLTSDGIVGQSTFNNLSASSAAQSNIIKWNGFEFEVLEQTEKYKVLKFRSWGTTVYLTKTLLTNADVKVGVGKQPRESLSSFYARKKPKFLINGGLFAMNNGNTMAVLKDETGLYGDNGFYFDGYCMTVKNGKVEFVQLVNFKDANNYDYVIEVAPSLVKNGQVVMDVKGLDKGFITGKHPRQAIGVDNTFFYTLTTDGRDESECGMTIEQLACLCKDLGMIYAGNLDGGGSTKLYIDGKKINSMDEDRAVDNFVYINIK